MTNCGSHWTVIEFICLSLSDFPHLGCSTLTSCMRCLLVSVMEWRANMTRAAPGLVLSLLAGLAGAGQQFGLTAYGEPCTDSCKQRGFPYAWCHKKPSWNGTFLSKYKPTTPKRYDSDSAEHWFCTDVDKLINNFSSDRDYCSPEFGRTRYLQTCLDNCERRDGKPFYWCHTRPTPRGDWDFCSPFPGDSCQWSSWGGWGGCSTSCGPGSRTRRRRMEGSDGRVGDCSGETEVAFQACNDQPCAGRRLRSDLSPREASHLWESYSTNEL